MRPPPFNIPPQIGPNKYKGVGDDNSTSIGRINLSKEKDRWLTA